MEKKMRKGVLKKEYPKENKEKPALHLYVALRDGFTYRYRDFLKITKNETLLELLMDYAYLGYPLEYFNENESEERIKLILKAVIDGGRTLPNNIFEITDGGIFKEALKLIAKGLNPYKYDLTLPLCTQTFLTELRKSIERNTNEEIDINSFGNLKELKDRLDGKKTKENTTEKIDIVII